MSETMKLRGAIITGAIDTEEFIERLIQSFFFKDNSLLGDLFSEKVIQHKNISFQTKYEILKELIKDKVSKDELLEYNKQVSEAIQIRNKYAHGRIEFKETEPYLISHGRRKELKLDKKALEEATSNFKASRKILLEIAKKL